MERSPPATSLLQFLTHANPMVTQQKEKGKSNTRNKQWLLPRQLKKWDEFEFRCLETIYGGTLLQEARREGRSLPHYPSIYPETDCVVQDERATTAMIDKWTRSIVTSALEPIKDRFNPVIWKPGQGRLKREVKSSPTPDAQRIQPPRQSSIKARKQRFTSLSRLRPDSGSVSSTKSKADGDPLVVDQGVEKFPKEYKAASNWTSEEFFARRPIDDDGLWLTGQANKDYAMPIRQAFTYCIKYMCRYGCILSCEEAFIFRIKPISRGQGEIPSFVHIKQNCQLTQHVYPEDSATESEKALEERLIRNSVMEYVSVPWSSHYGSGDIDEKWTVNLALWFLHVLAGNNHEADWDYVPLSAEELSNQSVWSSDDPETAAEPGMPISNDETTDLSSTDEEDGEIDEDMYVALKRKRDSQEDEEEGMDHSFTKRSFSSR